ncbi:aminoglycoside 6'-N-acetyltransferase [uncultured Methylobacterium sp.]|uniref:aminoglycoside 6'-N-acetyltransferase n=1 Tax=uncultured Methylobacterium sp. TaxID=157278 RepID=UPI002629FE82|nr:aminoglycoside 6'-N-acetyltransferase [uncultured Methylobacterium sp.]
MLIRIATSSDVNGWAALRARLWSGESVADHRTEAAALLARSPGERVTVVAVDPEGCVRAFAEASLRHDYVNGCDTSPVAFLEGIFVQPEDRRSGLGEALSAAVQSWARERGCTELASDALLENLASHAFHIAVGFEETERVVYFRKRIGPRR